MLAGAGARKAVASGIGGGGGGGSDGGGGGGGRGGGGGGKEEEVTLALRCGVTLHHAQSSCLSFNLLSYGLDFGRE